MGFAGMTSGFGTPSFYPFAQQPYWPAQVTQAGGGFGINPTIASQPILQLLQVVPQQLQQLQALQQQQLLHLQHLLQIVPAQLQQLQQYLQVASYPAQHLQQQPIAPALSTPAFGGQPFATASGHVM